MAEDKERVIRYVVWEKGADGAQDYIADIIELSRHPDPVKDRRRFMKRMGLFWDSAEAQSTARVDVMLDYGADS